MFYKVLRFVLQIIFGILFRPKILGKENVPMTGGMIMAANHLSNWDPPMVGTYMPRPVAYMAKEELFKPAIAGAVISNLYAFPVKRGAADRAAIKTALGILKQGLCLGVFLRDIAAKPAVWVRLSPVWLCWLLWARCLWCQQLLSIQIIFSKRAVYCLR